MSTLTRWGDAWRAAWQQDSTLALYSYDNFHPSLLGTYLAALVMFEQLTDSDLDSLPLEIPASSGGIDISQDLATLLRDAAKYANANFSRKP